MPSISQGHCSSCGYESPVRSSGHCGGVIVDHPATVESYAADPNDDRVVILAHPLEESIITKQGYTYASATLAGRYLCYSQYFCKACGQLYDTRKLSSAFAVFGGLPPIVIGVITGIAIGYVRSSFAAGLIGVFIATFVSLLVIDWMVGVYVRFRYTDRAREFRIKRVCPHCGSRRAGSGGTLPCPQCNQRTMKVKWVGMS